MSVTKPVDTRPKHLVLGDFELANVVFVYFVWSFLFLFESLHFSDCEEYVLCCKYSPTGDVFAVGLGNGTIKVSLEFFTFFFQSTRNF